jgi:hypothetical protein
MFGRRSHQRFTISTSPEGTLRMLRDVLIERIVRDEIVVISRHAGIVGDTLTLKLGESGSIALPVRVAESRPIVSDGTVRHRLSLTQTGPSNELETAIAPGRDPVPMIAVLSREIPVRVVNCSSSGCLLECTAPIEVGRIASLRLVFDGEELVDDLQIVRCQAIGGSSLYHVGVEFLWTAPPQHQSLRLGIGRSGDPQAQPAVRD